MKKLILLTILILLVQGFTIGRPIDESYHIQREKNTTMILDDITWGDNIIDNEFDKTSCIQIDDINEDGTMDIIGTSWDKGEIAWWTHSETKPFTWEKHIIATNFQGAAFVEIADLDGDGYKDVIGAAWDSYEIAWWKNDGNEQKTWSKQTLRTGYSNAHEVFAKDYDFDGDIDIFGASAGLNEITLWENNGESMPSWTEQKIGTCSGARSVYVADMDNDGDSDVLAADFTVGRILLFEQDVNENERWTKQIISSDFKGAHHVHAVDLNADGYQDIIAAGANNNKVSWWKNLGTSLLEWEEYTIDDSIRGALRVCVQDIDNDADLDIICTGFVSNKIYYLRNDGLSQSNWTKKPVGMFCAGAWGLDINDIDDDGDIDIVAGGNSGFSWYESNLYVDSKIVCQGSLSWEEIRPGTELSGTFTIENKGTHDSLLNWEIVEYPVWGTWNFDPNSGEGLSPADGAIEVKVTAIAPDQKNTDLSGDIVIANSDAVGDIDTIHIVLSTKRTKEFNFSFITPILNRILGFEYH